jgi:hypothetical protein
MRPSTCILALAGTLLAAAPAAAQLAADMKLEDAGFVMRRADTAQKLERIRALPPRQFVSRSKDGWRYYLYADPDYCRCVFLGDARALQAFRDMRRARLPQPDNVPADTNWVEDQMIRDMDADAGIGELAEGDILDFRF